MSGIKVFLSKLLRPSTLGSIAGVGFMIHVVYAKALGVVGAPGKAALVAMLMVVAGLGALVLVVMLDRGYDAVIARCRRSKP